MGNQQLLFLVVVLKGGWRGGSGGGGGLIGGREVRPDPEYSIDKPCTSELPSSRHAGYLSMLSLAEDLGANGGVVLCW